MSTKSSLFLTEDNEHCYYELDLNFISPSIILEIDKKNIKIIERFDTIRQACIKYNFKASAISMCLTKKNKTSNGYKWEYDTRLSSKKS